MEATITSSRTASTTDSTKRYNILYVDDEEANLRIFKYSFSREYNVFLALTGEEALEVIKSNDIHLIITDQRMPRMTGVDLLKMIVPKRPNIIRMILTGFSDVGALVEAVNVVGIHKYISKPWDRAQLKSIFEEELDRVFGSTDQDTGSVDEGENTELMDNVEFIQHSFLKEESYLREIFGNSVLIKHNPRRISSDIHWIGQDRSNQKIIVLLDTHLSGVIAGMISVGLYNIINEIVMASDKVDPKSLYEAIKQEYVNRYYDTNVRKHTDQNLNICILSLGDNQLQYFGNYSAIKIFDKVGNVISNGDTEGSADLSQVGKFFAYTNGMRSLEFNGQSLEDLMVESADLDFGNHTKFLQSQTNRLSGSEGTEDLTIIGVDNDTSNTSEESVTSSHYAGESPDNS